MKVILLENLRRVGSIGEIIDVKRGFARNYLISNKKALYASKENIAEVEKIKTELGKKDAEKKKEAQKISEQINGKEYLIKKLSTENKELYGSVKPTEISKLILENNKIDVKLFFKNGPTIKTAKPKKSPRNSGKPIIATGIKNLKISSNVSEWDIQWIPERKNPTPKR